MYRRGFIVLVGVGEGQPCGSLGRARGLRCLAPLLHRLNCEVRSFGAVHWVPGVGPGPLGARGGRAARSPSGSEIAGALPPCGL